MIKALINRILFPRCYSNEAYLRYLRKGGAQIGDDTRFIAPKECRVDGTRLNYISIGNNCCLVYASILAHDYSWYILKDAYNEILPDSGKLVSIGNNVFIGYKSVILPGTTIGDNVIIGAHAVVKGIIPANTVWAGNPAKQICTLQEYFEKRKRKQIEDAKFRRDFVKSKKGTVSISDMEFFSLLFLERTNENYELYLKNLQFNGIKNNKKIKDYFFNSKPIYQNFQEFLNI